MDPKILQGLADAIKAMSRNDLDKLLYKAGIQTSMQSHDEFDRDLEADLKICEAATPGPWHVTKYSGGVSFNGPETVYTGTDEEFGDPYSIPGRKNIANDTTFIAMSRTALPEYIKELKRVRGVFEEIASYANNWDEKNTDDLRDSLDNILTLADMAMEGM